MENWHFVPHIRSYTDYVNYDQFAPNFDMACKTMQHVSVPNLKLCGKMKTELWTKEVWEFSVMLYAKRGWWASWLPQYDYIDQSQNAKNWCIMAVLIFEPVLFMKNRVNEAQILQDLSYKVYSTTSSNFFLFGLPVPVLGIPLLYTSTLLLCYEDMWDSSIEIFRNVNSLNSDSCIYWHIPLKLAETFQNRVIYIV